MARGRKKRNNLLMGLEMSVSKLNRKQKNQIQSINQMVTKMNEQKTLIKVLVDSNKEIPNDLITSYHRKRVQIEEMLPKLFELGIIHKE